MEFDINAEHSQLSHCKTMYVYTVAVKTLNKQSKNNVNVPYMDVSLSISKCHIYEIDSKKVYK